MLFKIINHQILNVMKNRQELEQKIIEKAMKDATFRKQLIENPSTTLNIEFGFNPPENVEIKVLEEEPGKIYLVLPFTPAESSGDELSDAELRSVAGGSYLDCATYLTACGGPQCQ